jgi:hypothetical protein
MIAKYNRNNYENIWQAMYMALYRHTMDGFEDLDHNIYVDKNGHVWEFADRLMGAYATRWAIRIAETVRHIDRLSSDHRGHHADEAVRILGQILVYSNHEPDMIISAVSVLPSLLSAGIARYTTDADYHRPQLDLRNFPTMLFLVPDRSIQLHLKVARSLMRHNITVLEQKSVYSSLVLRIFRTIPVDQAVELTGPFRECDAMARHGGYDIHRKGYHRRYAARHIAGMMRLFAWRNRPLRNAVVD